MQKIYHSGWGFLRIFAFIIGIGYASVGLFPQEAGAQAKKGKSTKSAKAKTTPVADKAEAPLPAINEEVYEVIKHFYAYDKNIPLSAQVVATQNLPEGKREKIIFTGINNSRVPAYLALPKTKAASYPVVVLIDGINGSKERWFVNDNWPKGGLVTKALLKAGFAIMALDAVYHGERAAENNFGGVPSPTAYPYAATQMVMQTAVEHRRALDYLCSRPDIDTTRIGMLGLSMGGAITFALSCVDPRVKTAVAGLTPMVKQPEFKPWVPTSFAHRVRSDSFLMIIGTKDQYYSLPEAKQLYNAIPITKKEFVQYDIDHNVPAKYVGKVSDWFAKNLKPIQ